jgi:hypothetical protein
MAIHPQNSVLPTNSPSVEQDGGGNPVAAKSAAENHEMKRPRPEWLRKIISKPLQGPHKQVLSDVFWHFNLSMEQRSSGSPASRGELLYPTFALRQFTLKRYDKAAFFPKQKLNDEQYERLLKIERLAEDMFSHAEMKINRHSGTFESKEWIKFVLNNKNKKRPFHLQLSRQDLLNMHQYYQIDYAREVYESASDDGNGSPGCQPCDSLRSEVCKRLHHIDVRDLQAFFKENDLIEEKALQVCLEEENDLLAVRAEEELTKKDNSFLAEEELTKKDNSFCCRFPLTREIEGIFFLKSKFFNDFSHFMSMEPSTDASIAKSEVEIQISVERQAFVGALHSVRWQAVQKVVMDTKSKENTFWRKEQQTQDKILQKFINQVKKFCKMTPDRQRQLQEIIIQLPLTYKKLCQAEQSSPSFSNFELLSCCCIFQFLARYVYNYYALDGLSAVADDSSSDDGSARQPRQAQDDCADSAAAALHNNVMSRDRKRSVSAEPFRAESDDPDEDSHYSRPEVGVDAHSSNLEGHKFTSGGKAAAESTGKYDLGVEMNQLGNYLIDLRLHVSKLEESINPTHRFARDEADQETRASAFVGLQKFLEENANLLCYGSDDDVAKGERQKHVALAFLVLERCILDSEYFEEQDRKICGLAKKLNEIARSARQQPSNDPEKRAKRDSFLEHFDELCTRVSVEQLHFVFDIFDATNNATAMPKFSTLSAEKGPLQVRVNLCFSLPVHL